MTDTKKKCAECGLEIGPGTPIDVYKHTVACLNLPDLGREQLLKHYGGLTDEHARRVVANLS